MPFAAGVRAAASSVVILSATGDHSETGLSPVESAREILQGLGFVNPDLPTHGDNFGIFQEVYASKLEKPAEKSGSKSKSAPSQQFVKKVHVTFGNHFDKGYTGYMSEVVNAYFDKYIPQALNVSATLREEAGVIEARNEKKRLEKKQEKADPKARKRVAPITGDKPKDNFVWTMDGPWLASLYMSCPDYFFNDENDVTYDDDSAEERDWPSIRWQSKLNCPNQQAKGIFRRAIHRGDVALPAFPFNAQVEWSSEFVTRFGLQMVDDLAESTGAPAPRAFNQRDVPGTTIGLLRTLAAHDRESARGVSDAKTAKNKSPFPRIGLISIGENPFSTVPETVPGHRFNVTERTNQVSIWRNTQAINDEERENPAQAVLVYRGHAYASEGAEIGRSELIAIPGHDEILVQSVKNEADGPHTVAEVKKLLASVRRLFEGWRRLGEGDFYLRSDADVVSSGYNEFADSAVKFLGKQQQNKEQSALPVLENTEIGDTWIYGVASDPLRTAKTRIIMRVLDEYCGWNPRWNVRTVGARGQNTAIAHDNENGAAKSAAARCSPAHLGGLKKADPQLYEFMRFFVGNAEHTWGLPGSSLLGKDKLGCQPELRDSNNATAGYHLTGSCFTLYDTDRWWDERRRTTAISKTEEAAERNPVFDNFDTLDTSYVEQRLWQIDWPLERVLGAKSRPWRKHGEHPLYRMIKNAFTEELAVDQYPPKMPTERADAGVSLKIQEKTKRKYDHLSEKQLEDLRRRSRLATEKLAAAGVTTQSNPLFERHKRIHNAVFGEDPEDSDESEFDETNADPDDDAEKSDEITVQDLQDEDEVEEKADLPKKRTRKGKNAKRAARGDDVKKEVRAVQQRLLSMPRGAGRRVPAGAQIGNRTVQIDKSLGRFWVPTRGRGGPDGRPFVWGIQPYTYQTFGNSDFDEFESQYLPYAMNPVGDFVKSGMSNSTSEYAVYRPKTMREWTEVDDTTGHESHITQMTMPEKAAWRRGAPSKVVSNVTFDSRQSAVIEVELLDAATGAGRLNSVGQSARRARLQKEVWRVDLQLYNKTATRIPEASWFSIMPAVTPTSGAAANTPATTAASTAAEMKDCVVRKLDSHIDVTRVVVNGSMHLHGTYGGGREYDVLCRVAAKNDGETMFVGVRSLHTAVLSIGFDISPRADHEAKELAAKKAAFAKDGKTFVDPRARATGKAAVGSDDWPFPTPYRAPNFENAKHGSLGFCLHNNLWSTNYPVYYPFGRPDSYTEVRDRDAKFSWVIETWTNVAGSDGGTQNIQSAREFVQMLRKPTDAVASGNANADAAGVEPIFI